jgi:hypothetical protein
MKGCAVAVREGFYLLEGWRAFATTARSACQEGSCTRTVLLALLERITLWWPRALPAGSVALTAQTSAWARYLRGWGTALTRFPGLSCPNSQPAAPAVIQGC